MAKNNVAPFHQKQQATAQQAEAVADALVKVFEQPLFDWERPRVMVDTWEHGHTVVVWQEGPHGWVRVFPCGGMLSGTLWEVPREMTWAYARGIGAINARLTAKPETQGHQEKAWKSQIVGVVHGLRDVSSAAAGRLGATNAASP